MKKVIMIYDLRGDDIERIGFNRKLFQYSIQSHKGRYKTKSKGVLKDYIKLARSVVMFSLSDIALVKSILKQSKAKYKLYEVHKELK